MAALCKYCKGGCPNEFTDGGAVRRRRSSVPLVAVNLVDRVPVAFALAGEATLFVELAGGRQIGVAAGFDAATLRQLICVPEQD